MKTVKVGELLGKGLDYAVAMCEGATTFQYDGAACYWVTINGDDRALSSKWSQKQNFDPSTNWSIAGPIIDKSGIEINSRLKRACIPEYFPVSGFGFDEFVYLGETVLIAAMRCYVASKLGEEVEIPDELL